MSFNITEPSGFTPGPGTIRVTLDDGFPCTVPPAGAETSGSRMAADLAVTVVPIVEAVPSLSQWGLIAMAGLLAILVAYRVRSRTRQRTLAEGPAQVQSEAH